MAPMNAVAIPANGLALLDRPTLGEVNSLVGERLTSDMKNLIQAVSKASDGAIIINKDYRILYWNQAAESILGHSAEQVTGRYCYEVLRWCDEQGRALCRQFCRLALNSLSGEIPPSLELRAPTITDEWRWINVTTLAFPTGDQSRGDVIVHLFRDETRRKSAEQFLEQVIEMSKTLHKEQRPTRFSVGAWEASSNFHLNGLTPRESEVMHLLARGFDTASISNALTISSSTTRNHIKSILSKFGVHSRLEAVAYAYNHGLALPPDSQDDAPKPTRFTR